MSVNLMTKDGEIEIPNRGGGVSLELLRRVLGLEAAAAKIPALEEMVSELSEKLARLSGAVATATDYGRVKLSDSSTVTKMEGLALPATEKNAAISGTLANKISDCNNGVSALTGKMALPQGYGNYNKTLMQILTEIIVPENFMEVRTRRWFLNASKDGRNIWYTCIASLSGGDPEWNFSGILIPNWNEDAYLFYYYRRSNQWRFHKIANGADATASI